MKLLVCVIMLCSMWSYPAWGAEQEHKIGQKTTELPPEQNKADPNYPEINWRDLVPKDWDTVEEFSKFSFANFKDNDPKASEELKKMQSRFSNAPVDSKLDGKKITISGFMVPLEEANGTVTEFLLVSFYGACIHVPPPPANQIIHVVAKEPVRDLKAMAEVTIKGTLQTVHTDSTMGSSGYRVDNAIVEPHGSGKTCFFAPTC